MSSRDVLGNFRHSCHIQGGNGGLMGGRSSLAWPLKFNHKEIKMHVFYFKF